MSAALPYLRGLRKSDLVILAEVSDLKNFADFKKTELEAALDDHLAANKTKLSHEQRLQDYYRRLSQVPRGSPIKREPKGDASSVEDLKRSTRTRRVVKPKEEVEATDDSDSSSQRSSPAPPPPVVAAMTPARPTFKFPSLPPSPAVVTDAIDRQTIRVRNSISEAWDSSGLMERTFTLRSHLSSVKSINLLILALELNGVIRNILPLKYATTISEIPALHCPSFAIKLPDLFVLASASFWSPFLLWSATSLILPAVAAYFINISLKISQPAAGHTYGTRRASGLSSQGKSRANIDPLVYNVSKALVAYLVYANRFSFWNIFSGSSLDTVAGSVPGGLAGLLTGSALCTLGTLYEAILRK
ncbi:hypothetical protein FQN57_001396 [Myotisia sp. PD_48]|nr:hypothetical protein FQN57_001396 [Myotisia sp. PD_48]